jgi:hypothetical protein
MHKASTPYVVKLYFNTYMYNHTVHIPCMGKGGNVKCKVIQVDCGQCLGKSDCRTQPQCCQITATHIAIAIGLQAY